MSAALLSFTNLANTLYSKKQDFQQGKRNFFRGGWRGWGLGGRGGGGRGG